MAKKNLQGKKGVSPINKQAAYSKAAAHFEEALDTAVDIMRNSNNDNSRLGAAKVIIERVVPALKATELRDTEGNTITPIQIFSGLAAQHVQTNNSNTQGVQPKEEN